MRARTLGAASVALALGLTVFLWRTHRIAGTIGFGAFAGRIGGAVAARAAGRGAARAGGLQVAVARAGRPGRLLGRQPVAGILPLTFASTAFA